jgi:hypothetical protein
MQPLTSDPSPTHAGRGEKDSRRWIVLLLVLPVLVACAFALFMMVIGYMTSNLTLP